jgi:molybdenum cofactor cytidylyltransferase
MPPNDQARVAAVVLAAGSSSRMGQNKLLLELGGEALVRRAVRAAIESGLDPVVVVLGHEASRVRAAIGDLPSQVVVNEAHADGVGTSLKAGVAAVPAEAEALVVILADMPFVSRAMIGAVVERYRATRAPLVVSTYGEVDAPPILYDRALFAELLSDTGERCGKRVVRRHRNEAQVIACDEAALRDVDVPGDYEHARARMGG